MKCFLAVAFFFLPKIVFSQTYYVIGTITDEAEKPLLYANVFLKSNLSGAISDENGHFTIKTNSGGIDTIICKYMGYETYIKRIIIDRTQKLDINIKLKPQSTELNEVQIVSNAYTSGDKKGVTLSSLDVVNTPGAAADILRALQTFPGVSTVTDGAGLFVRGGDVSETAVILDGAYLYHPYKYESPNGGYFGQISPFLLKSTFFSTGGFGVEYGNSISGVLVMRSSDLPELRKIDLGVSLASAGVKIESPLINDKLGVAISTNYTNSTYMFKLNGHNKEYSKFPENYDLNVNLFYKYSDAGSLKLFLFHEADKVGVAYDNTVEEVYYNGANKSNLANLAWKHLASSKLSFNGNIALSTYVQNSDLGDATINDKNLLYQARLSCYYEFLSGIHSKLGIDFFNNEDDFEGLFLKSVYEPGLPDSLLNIDVQYKSKKLALYNRWDFTLFDKFTYSFGIRDEFESKSNQNVFDVRNALVWNFFNFWNLTISFGKYHQFPQANYLDLYVGNPNLKSFWSKQYISGLEYHKNSDIFRLEFYYKKYEDLILDDTIKNYSNNGYGYAKGIDIFFMKKWERIDCRLSVSLLDTKRKWKDVPVLAPTMYDIRLNINTVINYKLNNSWNVTAKFGYSTGKPYTSSAQTFYDKRTPDYHTLDLSLNHLIFTQKNHTIIIFAAANNLYGRKNIFGYRYSTDYSERVPVVSSMLQNFYFGINFTIQ